MGGNKKRTKVVPQSEFVCQYSSKPCDRARSAKKNGQLHRLCEYHRSRANRFQKEYKLRASFHKALQTIALQVDPIPFCSDECTAMPWDAADVQLLCDAIIA
ncbi:hypothetical protein LEN26_018633 [Aphanomyces euteiches]|uniref:Uncharacterized protein n=1 Tax=Aphanomyces euteiches TaxID=100861 RepID=A0A6G0XWZ3_9STRA|nr:hypothetical protein Ae201684_000281 [Aphanomyces euteiches]KAH9091715.1 hypothetical protein Ae201684P_011259 [Aphanomyces euteiches]KAH9092207.1 hypothetical protein LEN26_018633 [Aphanomyces euteiches]KAH9106206.1 hypothetical protein AeMF1_018122 [Aphanomyces euteiches]KAH9151095.1 hypothetical protein AeRB84_006218 [Aphanomyces euteiches]